MNVQVSADPFARLLWASPARQAPCTTAVRTHGTIEALTRADVRTWVDKGYQGAWGTE